MRSATLTATDGCTPGMIVLVRQQMPHPLAGGAGSLLASKVGSFFASAEAIRAPGQWGRGSPAAVPLPTATVETDSQLTSAKPAIVTPLAESASAALGNGANAVFTGGDNDTKYTTVSRQRSVRLDLFDAGCHR